MTEIGEQFLPCSVPECERRASDPPVRIAGKAICPHHAFEHAQGRCSACNGRLIGPYTSYAGVPDGSVLCVDCWANEGYLR